MRLSAGARKTPVYVSKTGKLRPHTEAEHAGILLWEMDWRIERENILAEIAAVENAA
jgi:hypothetical protein